MNNKIILSVSGMVLSFVLVIASAFLVEYKLIDEVYAIILFTVSMIFLYICIFYLGKIDYETGIYKCRKCGHTFKPTFKAYFWGAHTIKTRYLRCPDCGQKSWCFRKHREK